MSSTEIAALLFCVLMLIVFRFVFRGSKSVAKNSDSTRLARIQKASLFFLVCASISLFVGACWFLGFVFNWPFPIGDKIRIVVSHSHIYSSASEMPETIFWLTVIKQGLAFLAGGVLLRLFWLYSKGILFTAKNVNCLRFFGFYLIVNWFIDYQMQSTLRDMDLSMTPVFVGFFIIFFAWIMDEGRKIQEEQELTV